MLGRAAATMPPAAWAWSRIFASTHVAAASPASAHAACAATAGTCQRRCAATAAPSAPPPAEAPPASGAGAGAAGAASLDRREAAKFAALAGQWWSPGGPFAPLMALNPARCGFIREGVCAVRGVEALQPEPLAGLRALDVGCGGGLLSEPLARMGARVHGIDVAEESVGVASAHAALDPLVASRTRYEYVSAEALVAAGRRYDLVVASEVLEHVRRPADFVATLRALVAPGGQLVVSTLSRSLRAYALAVAAAEHVLRVVPRGTHDWRRFITPEELAMMGAEAGLRMELVAGMVLDPLTGRWSLSDDTGVNYIALLQPAAQARCDA